MALDPISSISSLVETVVTRIWPDKTEAEKAKFAMLITELNNEFQLVVKQVETNIEEAKTGKTFIAGWRPFIGWICGCAIAYHYILQPFLGFFTGWPMPALDYSELMTLLLGLLGLGAMRSFDKVKANGKMTG